MGQDAYQNSTNVQPSTLTHKVATTSSNRMDAVKRHDVLNSEQCITKTREDEREKGTTSEEMERCGEAYAQLGRVCRGRVRMCGERMRVRAYACMRVREIWDASERVKSL